MDFFGLLKRALISGVLCSLLYHGTLLIMGQTVTLRAFMVFTIVFTVLYVLWLWLTSMGRKK